MNLTVEIPDDIAILLSESGGDLSRRALESLAFEEFRNGNLTKEDLGRLLGFGTRWKLGGFLKAHSVEEPSTLEDFEQERAALTSLGL
jgi:hypothetical protein